MKYFKRTTGSVILRFSFLMIVLLGMVVSCDKEEDGKGDNLYLVDYTTSHLLSVQTIQSFLSILVNQYPEASEIKDNAQYSVQVYTIEYQTQYLDSVITASGLVCMPVAEEEFPVLSFQNGTNTAHDNAPTEDPFNEAFVLLESMASNGYIILIPDYIGFGSSNSILHPYYDRASSNRAVIDMLHAVEEMETKSDILALSNGSTFLMGYSQGGWATLSVLDEIENGETTGIQVAAASCGAGAYNLTTMANYIFGTGTYPGPLYLPYFLYSQMDMGYLTDPLSKYFKPLYAERIPDLFDGSYTNGEVNDQLTDVISDLVTDDLADNFQTGQDFVTLRQLLVENSVQAWNSSAEIHFYHGTSDQTVPSFQSADIYQDFIDAGNDQESVKFFELEGLDHDTGLLPWGISTLTWFNELKNSK